MCSKTKAAVQKLEPSVSISNQSVISDELVSTITTLVTTPNAHTHLRILSHILGIPDAAHRKTNLCQRPKQRASGSITK
eukprot:1138705-Rhodomonas_salina.4